MTEQLRWLTSREIRARYGLTTPKLLTLVQQGKIQRASQGNTYIYLDPGYFDDIRIGAQPNDTIPFLKGVEVASLLKISTVYLTKLGGRGKINFRTVGRNRRYSIRDVKDYVAYRESRKNLPNGFSKSIPKSDKKERREALIEWLRKDIENNS